MLANTFVRNRLDFTSVRQADLSCPPYIIVSAALHRLTPAAMLDLPDGYTSQTLENIADKTSFYDIPVTLQRRTAADMKHIGQQLLSLDADAKIEPPFTPMERLSIQHLIQTVPVKP